MSQLVGLLGFRWWTSVGLKCMVGPTCPSEKSWDSDFQIYGSPQMAFLPLPNIKCMKKWSKFKITNVCFIKTAGSSPRLQICSLLYIFGNKKPPQMVQSAGSKYWLPGFGGLIRGQIYNPEVRWFFRCFVLLASSRTGWRPFCKGQKPCKSFWCSGPIWTRRAADKFLDQTQMLHGTGIFAYMNT